VRTLVQSDNFFYVLTYSDVTWYFLRTATKVTFEIKTRRPQHNDNDHTGTFFINATSRAVLQDYKRQSTNQSSNHPSILNILATRNHATTRQKSLVVAIDLLIRNRVLPRCLFTESRFKHESCSHGSNISLVKRIGNDCH
jgi:type VI protein secretion system component VasA